METLSFTTPARTRTRHTVDVDLCGERMTVERPKAAVLFFAAQMAGSDVVDVDRAMSAKSFLDSALTDPDRKRFYDRVIDRADPVDIDAFLDLVDGLVARFSSTNTDTSVLVIDPTPGETSGEPVKIVNDDLDLEVIAHPPKELVRLFVRASLATGANAGQQAWAVAFFLDSALDPGDRDVVSRRLAHPGDLLDLEDIIDIVNEVNSYWSEGPRNRADRRAAAKRTPAKRPAAKKSTASSSTTKTTARAKSTSSRSSASRSTSRSKRA